ncbi:MAG: type IV pilus assembly protein PilM [Parcubacteria group bacterium]|nr:type IV pilus assembly protein PilM [Parcubacteria group bacterium]
MKLFGSRKSYVGIDIGSAQIKMVEVEERGGHPALVTYGLAAIANGLYQSARSEIIDETAAALKNLSHAIHVGSTHAITALPGLAVFSSLIEIPWVPEKQLASAIRWEAEQYVPTSLDEVVLDWSFTIPYNPRGKKGDMVSVLVTAAPKELVAKYLTTLERAEFTPVALEVEPAALARALTNPGRVTPIALLDLGASSSDITVVEQGTLRVNRSIPVGAQVLVNGVAKTLGIDAARAESLLKREGMRDGEGSGVVSTIKGSLDQILKETRLTLDLYFNRFHREVKEMIITGGMTGMPGLVEYIGTILNDIEIVPADPWRAVSFPPELASVLTSIGPNYAVALGLALREFV